MHSRLAESETLSRDRWTADARAGLDRRCRYSGVLGEGWGVLAGDCWILSVAWPVTLERLNGIPTLERGNDQTIKWLGAWGTIKNNRSICFAGRPIAGTARSYRQQVSPLR